MTDREREGNHTMLSVYEIYIAQRQQGEIPHVLTDTHLNYEGLRREFHSIPSEQITSDLGSEATDQEKACYTPIGMGIASQVLDLFELGSLIAADPLSPNNYTGGREQMLEMLNGFVEEGTAISSAVFLIKDSDSVRDIIERSKSLLQQKIDVLTNDQT